MNSCVYFGEYDLSLIVIFNTYWSEYRLYDLSEVNLNKQLFILDSILMADQIIDFTNGWHGEAEGSLGELQK